MDQHSTIPRVSIGLPVYNGERYLEETLNSVLKQTFSDFTLIISDNASRDKTEKICRSYAERDHRINYIRSATNLGASKNYERCFRPAQSEYFRWQNADDPIEENLLENCVKILDEEPDIILAYGKTKIIDEHGVFLEDYNDNMELLEDRASDRFITFSENIGLQNLLYGLMRRDALSKTALLGNYAASDFNLIGELCLYGKFKEIPIHLFCRRMHPDASSWDRSDTEKQKDFWDPAKRRFVMQTWRSIYEYFKAMIKAPIPLRDKRALAYYLLKNAYWDKQVLKNELVDLIKSGKSN